MFHVIWKEKVRDLIRGGVRLEENTPGIKDIVLDLHADAYNEWAEAIGWSERYGDVSSFWIFLLFWLVW
jgi:hypothetical protein